MMSSIKQEAAKHISLRRINVAFNLILKLHLYVHIYTFSFIHFKNLFIPLQSLSPNKSLIKMSY